MPYLSLIAAFTLNAAANVLLKIGAKKGFIFSGIKIQTILENRFFFLGFVCFSLNVLFYFYALRSISISTAYPVMVGMSLLIINTISYFFLGESMTAMQIFGCVLLLIGVTIIFTF